MLPFQCSSSSKTAAILTCEPLPGWHWVTGDWVSLLEAFGLKHISIFYFSGSACGDEQAPRGTDGKKHFLAIYQCKKVQFPDEVLSSSLDSASFLDISWRCSQSGLPGPPQDFEVKEQRWWGKMYSLMGSANSGPHFPAVGLSSLTPPWTRAGFWITGATVLFLKSLLPTVWTTCLQELWHF